MENVSGEIVLPQSDERERKLKIDWPPKDELMRDRNKYVKDHLDEEIDFVRGVDDSVPPDMIDQVAKMSLDAKYMLGLMQKISPIPLDAPINIKLINDKSVTSFSGSYENENGRPETTFYIHIPAIMLELRMMQNKWQLLMDADNYRAEMRGRSIDISREVAMAQAVKNVDNKKAESALSFAVHEFAHFVYAQEAFRNKGGSKDRGLQEENEFVDRNVEPTQEYGNDYAQLDMENRARIWQNDFLNHYFPNSEQKKFNLELMEKGFRLKKERA